MDRGISQDELVSRGGIRRPPHGGLSELRFSGQHLLASLPAGRYRGSAASYEALRRTASGRRVIPPASGAMPDGSVKTFTRGGS